MELKHYQGTGIQLPVHLDINYNIIKNVVDLIHKQKAKINVQKRTLNKIVKASEKSFTIINKLKITENTEQNCRRH